MVEVFRRMWEGQKRREIARELGMGIKRVKALQAQVRRRLGRGWNRRTRRKRSYWSP